MTLLRADGPLPLALKPMHDAAGTHYGDPKNGWQHWTSGRLDVIDVPGDHLVLMKEPYVETVAARSPRCSNPPPPANGPAHEQTPLKIVIAGAGIGRAPPA